MKLAEAKDAPCGVGSFSRLREKAGDEGGLRYADTLTPTLSRKREGRLAGSLDKTSALAHPNPLPPAGEGARFMRHGWREAQRITEMNTTTTTVAGSATSVEIPKASFDYVPLALVALLALLAWPLIGSTSSWLTLTVAGLAMGMIIFIIASGLTLVFGLMDVLNFGHGVFIALGAFVATTVLGAMGDWTASTSLWRNLAAVFAAMLVAMALAGAVGLAFERVLVRPVYGQHLKQILITMGGMIIGEELIKVIWGPDQRPLPLPEALRGSLLLGDAAIGKYRVLAVAIGIVVFVAMLYALNRTKIGLLVRAGVQDREMVESLGYRIRRLFVGVFVVGLGARRARRRDVGAVPAKRDPAARRAGHGADLHRHHHRRARLDARLLRRRAAGRAAVELRRLPRAEGRAVLEHRADGRDPAVAAAGAVSGDEPVADDAMAIFQRLLSHDLPRSRWLAIVLVVMVVGLALTPFLFPGTKALNVAAKILVFIVLVASYDLLLGYTGIVSFAHTMFFGIGAYGVAIASTRLAVDGEVGFGAIAVGIGIALVVSLLLSLVIGLFSLRVKAIFFAMITLAVASAFLTLASQLSDFTGGEDGLTFKVPALLQPSTSFAEEPFLGAALDGRFASYYLLFVATRRAAARDAAHREFAVRARADGDPRERLPRRGDRLPDGRSTARCPTCSPRCSPRSPARCSRSGCATTGRTRRSASRSCSTSC